jgi:hypothetical protein
MIEFWLRGSSDNPSSYNLYMKRVGDDYRAMRNSDIDTWRISPDHETERGDNQEALSELILKIGSPVLKWDDSKGALRRAAGSSTEKVWVLKGLHQKSNPHLTLGFDGQIYHANVDANPGPYLSICSISLAPGQKIDKGALDSNWRAR